MALAAAASLAIEAQGPPPGGRGGGPPGGRGGPPRSPREGAPVDLTGYWVSVVTEDWRWRMVTPARGDFAGVPLTPAARKLGQAWDPAKDEAAGEQCRGYGAPAIMRVPGRLRITWQDDTTLKVESDAGTQTRLLPLRRQAGARASAVVAGLLHRGLGRDHARSGEPDFLPIALNPREGMRGQSLEVTTTHLRPGYLRKNGVPYSARTTLKEYFDVRTERNGDTWFVVTTIVEDPEYLTTPFVTTTDFKKQPDATGWNPTACSAR